MLLNTCPYDLLPSLRGKPGLTRESTGGTPSGYYQYAMIQYEIITTLNRTDMQWEYEGHTCDLRGNDRTLRKVR